MGPLRGCAGRVLKALCGPVALWGGTVVRAVGTQGWSRSATATSTSLDDVSYEEVQTVFCTLIYILYLYSASQRALHSRLDLESD